MFERFTDRCRKVVAIANQEALSFGQECLQPEHMLLGLMKEGTGVGANALKNLSVDLSGVIREVETLKHLVRKDAEPAKLKLPQSEQAKQVIVSAIKECRALGHNYVGTEHLLLGLLHDPNSLAVNVFMNLGVKTEDIRREILEILKPPPTH